ncbi:MAG: hypothetical protein HY961_01535 [Ignavibacteriae bacterium]|nr:hypothetical protein [Ignavibacteriota bacterium]
MQRFCQILGWGLLSVLLVSGGGMSYLIITQNPFWTESPIRQHLIPMGHAHAAGLGIVTLLFGLYLDKVNLSEQVRKWAAIIFVTGVLLLPGGFILGVIQSGATSAGKEFILVPIGGVLIGIGFVTMFIGMIKKPKVQ